MEGSGVSAVEMRKRGGYGAARQVDSVLRVLDERQIVAVGREAKAQLLAEIRKRLLAELALQEQLASANTTGSENHAIRGDRDVLRFRRVLVFILTIADLVSAAG